MAMDNKVALIAGGSRGIGKSIATELAKNGVRVAIIGRNLNSLKDAENEINKSKRDDVLMINYDLSDTLNIKSVVDKVIQKYGRLDFLINSAGVSSITKDPYDCNLSEWDNALDINFRSVYHLCTHSLHHIKKQNGGVIINIGSLSATFTYKQGAMYCPSKHALLAYSKCLYENVRYDNIKVSCINPGFVNTEMGREDNLIPENMIQPQDIAKIVIGIIESPHSINPVEINVKPMRNPYKEN